MKRRAFIRTLSGLAGGLACSLPAAFGNAPIAGAGLWYELLEYARWCPSPHNVQPWKLQLLSATAARLYYDPARVPGVVDTDTSFTIAGMGMFIECLNLAAQKRGLSVVAVHAAEPRLSTVSGAPRLFADLQLVPFDGPVHFDRELIRSRRTSRLTYDVRAIAPSVLRRFQEVVAAGGHELIVSQDAALIHDLIRLNTDTLLQRSDETATMAEMNQWVRSTEVEAAAKKDGLWSRANAVSPRVMHNFFFHHHRFDHGWKRAATRRMLNRGMAGTPHLAWIKGLFSQRADWVAAGTLLQRLWLALTQESVYMHPLGTVITTPDAKAAFLRRTGAQEEDGMIWLLVRLGFSEEPARSYRLDVSDLLLA